MQPSNRVRKANSTVTEFIQRVTNEYETRHSDSTVRVSRKDDERLLFGIDENNNKTLIATINVNTSIVTRNGIYLGDLNRDNIDQVIRFAFESEGKFDAQIAQFEDALRASNPSKIYKTQSTHKGHPSIQFYVQINEKIIVLCWITLDTGDIFIPSYINVIGSVNDAYKGLEYITKDGRITRSSKKISENIARLNQEHSSTPKIDLSDVPKKNSPVKSLSTVGSGITPKVILPSLDEEELTKQVEEDWEKTIQEYENARQDESVLKLNQRVVLDYKINSFIQQSEKEHDVVVRLQLGMLRLEKKDGEVFCWITIENGLVHYA